MLQSQTVVRVTKYTVCFLIIRTEIGIKASMHYKSKIQGEKSLKCRGNLESCLCDEEVPIEGVLCPHFAHRSNGNTPGLGLEFNSW